ncbi:hypothetical protein MNB_SV-15-963 [hydrothermal vent metagenome]|uniref:Uncharacterized protein n=1 Tax=hydrothermal vent metagenome TaxID=652676 RepID=A0A1W1EKQ9_9ZZZZ
MEMDISKIEDKKKFVELKDLYENLDILYAEGKILSKNDELNKSDRKIIHQKWIKRYEELYNETDKINIIYKIAEEISNTDANN